MMEEKIFKHLHEHKPITVNYGKGYFTDGEIKETAYYDETMQKYVSDTGIWSNNLLRQIIAGNVEGVSLELEEEELENEVRAITR